MSHSKKVFFFIFQSSFLLTSGEVIGVWISDFDPNPDSMDFSVLRVGVLGGGGGGVHLNKYQINI